MSPAQTVREGVEFDTNVATGGTLTVIVSEIVEVLTIQPLNALLWPSITSIVIVSPLAIAVAPAPNVIVLVPINC